MGLETKKRIITRFWEDAIGKLEKVITLTKEYNLQNDLDMLNFIDQVNKLSVEF